MRASAILCAGLSMAPATAVAHGQFPMSLAVFAPPEMPHRLVLATNFGLSISDDDGAHWKWTCEQLIDLSVYIYRAGPGSAPAYFAIAPGGLFFSHDGGCAFTIVEATRELLVPYDVSPDPVDPARVFMIA